MSEQVILAVGDACGPPDRNPAAVAVGQLGRRILEADPAAIVLALGDNAYNRGRDYEYTDYYDPVWGFAKDRTWACAGNHDYRTSAASPYFTYFGERAAGTCRISYYSFDLGGWHIVSLNSEVEQDRDSPQLRWLRRDLETRQAGPILAIWHRARWGSGAHRDSRKPRWFWNELYAHRAELVLNGHSHHYERFAPQRPDQVADARGIRQFIVGTGGRKLSGRSKFTPHSEAARFDVYGLLKLTLRADGYRWDFVSQSDEVVDTGESPTNR
jgi:calcineurin-like phosphoesterase family protein